MRWRATGLIGACLLASATPAVALCTDASAHAKAQDFGALMQQKMPSKPDETGDLADEFGEIMTEASHGVTEKTCGALDSLVRRAKAL